MKTRCPHPQCLLNTNPSPEKRLIIRKGFFFRKSDSKYVRRFFCKSCGTYFSNQTGKPSCYQKQRRITPLLKELVDSGVSQRRAARILKVNPKTVIRRFRFIAAQERLRHEEWVKLEYKDKPLDYVQFDDLETAEHTKCKPLSVALAVDPKTRKILNFQVNQMPAKGLLVHKALQKYGYRKDERALGWDQMMKELLPIVRKDVLFRSDENPHYPKFVKKYHPLSTHETRKGGRGAVAGQGELKKLRFDPLFSLNHTCAMLRANLNRLFRRTWCISKNKQGLIDHISIYVTYHNLVLTASQAQT
jgi:transposase-like protein